MKTYYRCPICKAKTEKTDKSYVCENRHLFDVSSEGYVNFAAAKKGISELSGDAADAIRARRSFLEKGYYKVLSDALCAVINENAEKISTLVIDAGCGEGYYSRQIKQNCPHAEVYGIDLSKQGVKMAAKAEKNTEKNNNYCVAGIFDMPFEDGAAGAVVSVFAPVANEEFLRVLEKGGILIVACPGKKHLYGLKEMLYREALENEEKIPEIDGFELVKTDRITQTIELDTESAANLFLMTPYFWRSSKDIREKSKTLESAKTDIDFIIKVYRKI